VVLVSSEAEDLAAACDRVVIYSPGLGVRPATSTTPDALISQIYAAADAGIAGSPA
jgi:ABC-type sugar transport system ATPase subunit